MECVCEESPSDHPHPDDNKTYQTGQKTINPREIVAASPEAPA